MFLFIKCFNGELIHIFMPVSQPAKIQKKQCGGVNFGLYGISYIMLIQQKLTPTLLLFSIFVDWDIIKLLTTKMNEPSFHYHASKKKVKCSRTAITFAMIVQR